MEIQKSNDHAAYRELFEETGISQDDVKLEHFMDLNYFKFDNIVKKVNKNKHREYRIIDGVNTRVKG